MRKAAVALLVLLVIGAAWPAGADAVEADQVHAEVLELLTQLPELPPAQPLVVEPPRAGVEMAAGVRIIPGQRVILDGTILFSQGPIDGLEVLACLHGGKQHESLIGLTTDNAQLVKAACIAALGLTEDGIPAREASGVPSRGVPVAVSLVWQPDQLLEPDRWVSLPASHLVRDRHTDRAFGPLPWIYTGSEFVMIEQDIPGKGMVRQERFMLEVTKSVAVNFDEPHALLASPFPNAAEDQLFEVNSRLALPERTPAFVVIEPCELPLYLQLGAGGAVHLLSDAKLGSAGAGPALDDDALIAALRQQYRDEAAPQWRAIGVYAPIDALAAGAPADAIATHQQVVAARARLMRLAVRAGVWAVPVFMARP